MKSLYAAVCVPKVVDGRRAGVVKPRPDLVDASGRGLGRVSHGEGVGLDDPNETGELRVAVVQGGDGVLGGLREARELGREGRFGVVPTEDCEEGTLFEDEVAATDRVGGNDSEPLAGDGDDSEHWG